MSSASRLALPTRKRTYRFALTPFADAMFQLLIFFMLSSSLTPYSLLTLQTGTPDAETSTAAGNDPAAAAAPPPQPAGVPQDVALWTIEAGTVRVGGQDFEFDALPALADALGTPSSPASVILLVRASARVQDIASVLEALQAANVGSVQVSTGAI